MSLHEVGRWRGPDAESQTIDELLATVDHLQTALASRDVIGQAKGIVRMLLRCDAEAAFILLTKVSQDCNRKITDLAELVADCSAAGKPLPADVQASWHRRSAQAPRRH